jgi:polyphenol oxidase
VRAVFTLRGGGVSVGPCASLNIATHVDDDPAAVTENRRRIAVALALPSEPAWLSQVHGDRVVWLRAAAPADAAADPGGAPGALLRADAAVTTEAGRVCAIQVADCLPVLFSARDGSTVGAAHAGWRGLAAGVLERTVGALGVPPAQLLAWIGPGIGQANFEVGPEVRDALIGAAGAAAVAEAAAAFLANARGRWQCDLAALVRLRLAGLGLMQIFGGSWCTFADAERFFSYRRDRRCGRMAALIWRG